MRATRDGGSPWSARALGATNSKRPAKHISSDAPLLPPRVAFMLVSPVFDRISRQPRMAALARALGLVQPLLLQSMYLFKQPQIGAEVGWHQDATYLYTRPVTVTGLWIALDDADRDNGCLMALSGGHRGPRGVRPAPGRSTGHSAGADRPVLRTWRPALGSGRRSSAGVALARRDRRKTSSTPSLQ